MYQKAVFASVLVFALFLGCATVTDHEMDHHDEDPRVAEHMEQEMAEFHPSEPSANRHYVTASNAWDDPERAIDEYSIAIDLRPDFALAYFSRAHLLWKIGQGERALDDLNRAIEIDPGFLQAYLERANLRMWEMGDEGGFGDIEMAYSIDPNDLEAAHAFAGLIEWENPREAEEIYGRMTDIHPDRPEAFVRFAEFFLHRGDYAVAAEVMSLAIELAPYDSWLYTEAGHMLLFAGRYEEARHHAELAMEFDPDNPDARLLAARLAAIGGDVDLAFEMYESYIGSEWFDHEVLLEIAYVAAARGSVGEANNFAQQFLEQNDDDIRFTVAIAGTGALNGEVEPARDQLDQMLLEADWHLPLWFMRALLAADEEGERAEAIIAEAAARVAGFEPSPSAFFPEHLSLWIWAELFLQVVPAARTLDLPRP